MIANSWPSPGFTCSACPCYSPSNSRLNYTVSDTRGDKSFWNIDSEHSINSFNKSEIEQYVPSGVPCEGGNNNIWEQNGLQ